MTFCHHCGKELKGDETRCPECGAPTGVSGGSGFTPSQQKKGLDPSMAKTLAVIVALLICSVALFALFPWNEVSTDSYTVTVSVDSISIQDSNSQMQTYDGYCHCYISMTCSGSSDDIKIPNTNDGYWNCPTDKTSITSLNGNTANLTANGSKSSYTYTIFFMYKTATADAEKSVDDYIDIYDDSGNLLSTAPEIYGTSGVVVSQSTIEKNNGTVTVSGDSQPLGSVTLTFKFVKN
jgi:hypothetical protein